MSMAATQRVIALEADVASLRATVLELRTAIDETQKLLRAMVREEEHGEKRDGRRNR